MAAGDEITHTSGLSVRPVDPIAWLDVAGELFERAFGEPYGRPAVENLLATAGAQLLVATGPEEDGGDSAPLGYVIVTVFLQEAEILSIGVLPGARGRGVGKALMKGAVKLAGGQADAMFLEVGVDNAAAIALYRAMGFEQVGRRKDYYKKADQSRVDALVMRLELLQ